MRTTLLTLLTIAGILAAATWTARLNSLPASAAATSPMHVIPPASADPIASPAPTRSPLAVAKALHTRRAAKDDLSQVAPFIAESRRAGTLQFLTAVDGVLAADAALHARVLQAPHVSRPESGNLRLLQGPRSFSIGLQALLLWISHGGPGRRKDPGVCFEQCVTLRRRK